MTDDYVDSVSERYIELYEHIVGEKFDRAVETGDIAARIEHNVSQWLKNR
jgi:phosphoribosylaminoimidazole-succinocarboxamide synthase